MSAKLLPVREVGNRITEASYEPTKADELVRADRKMIRKIALSPSTRDLCMFWEAAWPNSTLIKDEQLEPLKRGFAALLKSKDADILR